jgi:hypothetical protein
MHPHTLLIECIQFPLEVLLVSSDVHGQKGVTLASVLTRNELGPLLLLLEATRCHC